MRRYYQHHAAQLGSSSPALAAPTAAEPSSPLTLDPSVPPRPLTGIMALRNVGKLAGTVKEQLEAERAREGDEGVTEEEERVRDAQMKSGIGLPLARMFAE